jgi:hypothetical protein
MAVGFGRSGILDCFLILVDARFPLGSRNHREKTLADEVLESFGVTFPLLQFHTVRSRCPSPSKGVHAADGFDTMSSLFLPLLQTTNGKPLLKSHPCIITR